MKKNASASGANDPAQAAARSRVRSRLLAAVCLLAAVGAGVFLFMFWKQWAGPGKRHYLRGLDYIAAQDYAKAEQEWLAGTREDPRSPQCFQRLGDYYAQLQRFDEAERYYAAAAKLDTSNGELFLNLSRVQQTLNKKQDALLSAQRAANLLSNDAEAQEQYGSLADKQYKRDEARRALQRAHELKPGNDAYTLALITLKMNQMDLAAAEQDLASFLQTHPKDPQACYLLAVIYSQKPRTPENLAQALTYARRAMPGMVRELRGYTLLGSLYLQADNPRRALLVYQRAFAAFPYTEGSMQGLVDTYRKLGDAKQSAYYAGLLQKVAARHDRMQHLRQMMGFNHNDVRSGLELARLEEEDGDSQKAFVYLQELLRQSPQNREVRSAFVAYLQRAGHPDLAQTASRPDFVP